MFPPEVFNFEASHRPSNHMISSSFFSFTTRIGATIRIGQEIFCLLYAEFFFTFFLLLLSRGGSLCVAVGV